MSCTLGAKHPWHRSFFALVIVNEIGDIRRFAGQAKLRGYAGLVPAVYASGGTVFHAALGTSARQPIPGALAARPGPWPSIPSPANSGDLESDRNEGGDERRSVSASAVGITRRLGYKRLSGFALSDNAVFLDVEARTITAQGNPRAPSPIPHTAGCGRSNRAYTRGMATTLASISREQRPTR